MYCICIAPTVLPCTVEGEVTGEVRLLEATFRGQLIVEVI
jgi:hypothetical protein